MGTWAVDIMEAIKASESAPIYVKILLLQYQYITTISTYNISYLRTLGNLDWTHFLAFKHKAEFFTLSVDR